MITAVLTLAATASVLCYALLGYIPRILLLTSIVCLLIIIF